jgi:pimeloyl-ACP methyl ester carboxylesterase
MGKIVCNGVALNYRTVGAGSDVVLIHGLASNHAFWRIEVLLSLAKSYRLTVFDLRGHGYSDMPPSGYSLEDMAGDLHCLLDNLDILHAHIIGHSFGGAVALQYAADHPARVLSLTIADSRIRVLQPTNYAREWLNSEVAIKKLGEIGLDVPEDESESGLWLLEQLAHPKWQKARHKFEGSQLFIPFGGWNGGQRTAEQWLKLLNTTTARQDVTAAFCLTIDKLSSIRLPVLAMYGDHSSALPSLRGLQKYLSNCRKIIVPEAGHFYPFTRPGLFAGEVSNFLKEQEDVKPLLNL